MAQNPKKLSEYLQGKYELTRPTMHPGVFVLPETGDTKWDFTTMDKREADALIAATGDKYLKKKGKTEEPPEEPGGKKK